MRQVGTEGISSIELLCNVTVWETKDNNITSNSEESGMGNEVSHSEGVKQSVGGEGHTGQFHKVFVEPEVSHGSDDITTDELSSAGIHNEATLQIRY
ncbi:hypothetical protein ACF0H5_007486 [Mactra antiquata]